MTSQSATLSTGAGMNLCQVSTQSGVQVSLLEEAVKSTKSVITNSYSPYSRFRVSAALVTSKDEIITGVNVENASYGLTICAERNAICTAMTRGQKDLKMITVYAPEGKGPSMPCGACRQFLVEFNPDMMVLLIPPVGEDYQLIVAKDLLPHHFGPHNLS